MRTEPGRPRKDEGHLSLPPHASCPTDAPFVVGGVGRLWNADALMHVDHPGPPARLLPPWHPMPLLQVVMMIFQSGGR